MVSPSSVFEPTRPRPSCQSHITVTTDTFGCVIYEPRAEIKWIRPALGPVYVRRKESASGLILANTNRGLCESMALRNKSGAAYSGSSQSCWRLYTAFQIENIPAHHPQDDVVSSQ